jgi:hypothetical protein
MRERVSEGGVRLQLRSELSLDRLKLAGHFVDLALGFAHDRLLMLFGLFLELLELSESLLLLVFVLLREEMQHPICHGYSVPLRHLRERLASAEASADDTQGSGCGASVSP